MKLYVQGGTTPAKVRASSGSNATARVERAEKTLTSGDKMIWPGQGTMVTGQFDAETSIR